MNNPTLYLVLAPSLLSWTLLSYLRHHTSWATTKATILSLSQNPILLLSILVFLGIPTIRAIILIERDRKRAASIAFHTSLAASLILRVFNIFTLAALDLDIAWTAHMGGREMLVARSYAYCCGECVLLVYFDLVDYYLVCFSSSIKPRLT